MAKRTRVILTLPEAVYQAIKEELAQQPEHSLSSLLSSAVRSHYAKAVHKPAKAKPEQQMPDPETNLPEELRNLMKDWPDEEN